MTLVAVLRPLRWAKTRAPASAMTLPSVPELVKRTRSIDGMRSTISLASLASFALRPA